ncbi:MAG: hypothetical protein IAE91_03400 [Ignavibacteriaceae bacterium]|nr:hypothetical protein [Ignavibacteriaceae bacterium]
MIEKGIKYTVFRTISNIFLPPFATFISIIVVSSTFQPDSDKRFLFILIGLITNVILPILVFVIMLKKGKIGDQDARERTERAPAYIYGIYILLAGGILIFTLGFSKPEILLYIAITVNLCLLLIVNSFWKMSAHLMGVGGMSATLIFSGNIFIIPSLFVILIVILSRIYLKCHTLGQTVAGAITGFAVTWILLSFSKNIQ